MGINTRHERKGYRGVNFLSCRYHPYYWLTVNGTFHSIYCSHQLKDIDERSSYDNVNR